MGAATFAYRYFSFTGFITDRRAVRTDGGRPCFTRAAPKVERVP
jgi:hypothetical protein